MNLATPYLVGSSSLWRVCVPGATEVWNTFQPQDHVVHTIESRILTHRHARVLLRSLDQLYILVGKKSEERMCTPQEKKWNDILSPALIQEMEQHEMCTLGMVLVTNQDNVFYIEWIESFLKGYNVAATMMSMLERECEACIPRDISGESFQYWQKYFSFYANLAALQSHFRVNGVDLERLIGYENINFEEQENSSSSSSPPPPVSALETLNKRIKR